MDTFFEQIIAVRKTGKAIAAVIGLWLAAFILAALIFLFIGPFSPFSLLLFAGIIYGAWKLSSRFNIEYEYIITNGTMDIDKIINKGARKRVASFELGNVSRLEKFNPAALNSLNAKQSVIACDLTSPDAYLMVSSSEQKGSTAVVFAPDDRIKSAVVKFIPKFIANSAFK